MKVSKDNNSYRMNREKAKREPIKGRRRKIDRETVRNAAKLVIDLHRDALKELERH